MLDRVRMALTRPTASASLGVFRVFMGAALLYSTLRFVAKGFVETLYLEPAVHFPYWGFEFVQALSAEGMYALFAVMGVASLGITLGVFYRLSCALFWLAFTYVELIDQTTYLNHYYFVSLLVALMALMPLDRVYALRTVRDPSARMETFPGWVLWVLRIQVGVVYFFAGVAKLRPDWLLHAMPLRLWLPVHTDLPLVGPLMDDVWLAYAFSWAGAIFDLGVVPALLHRRTRPYAYAALATFHLMTGALFRIGVFPIVMTLAALVFFAPDWPERLLARWRDRAPRVPPMPESWKPAGAPLTALVVLFALFHFAMPLRRLAYPGDTAWSEEGFRFAWQVMLVEKTGLVRYRVVTDEGERVHNPRCALADHQRRFLASQPDLILRYAHRLRDEAVRAGGRDVRVYADAWVSYNGRPSQRFVDPDEDLAAVREGLGHKPWILPLEHGTPPAPARGLHAAR